MYPNASRRAFCQTIAAVLWAVVPLAQANLLAQASGQKAKSEKENTDDEAYEVGDDVKAPKLVHYVEPEFSPKSKEAYVDGTVKISTVVTTDGVTSKLRVVSGLNAEEDRTAMEAVKQWRFQPGTKNGQPVNVRVTIEVTFRLL